MTKTRNGRRAFLRNLAALSSAGLASRFDALNMIASGNAQQAGDYKALVCVFMFGGNDGNNTVIPIDNAGYAQYAAVRPASSGINLLQASLLPIQPAGGSPFGLHPALTDLQTLFNKGKLAVLANVGTLVQPITKAQYASGLRPLSLYSHSDQQAQWQSSISDTVSGSGWGGRIADKVASLNVATGFPVVTSLDGTVLFTTGQATSPLAIPVTGSFALAGYTTASTANNARLAAVKQLLGLDSNSALVNGANDIGSQALNLSSTVNPILASANSTVTSLFAGLKTNTANQLFQVAKLIEARAATGARRQIFFVQLGSFDTHGDQLNRQQTLFTELSPALKAFYDATTALNVAGQVTTFTLSDFGRTFQPASGGGTDHAWGNHHFIMGDAVHGGTFYGQYPQLLLGGPSDAESEGRWLPTTSVDQYGATLAKWFGVASADLSFVFPNLSKFASSDLGFLG